MSRHGGHCLAWARGEGHASARATIRMVAGLEERGSSRSKDVIFKYEHLAVNVHRIKSKDLGYQL